MPKLKRLSGRQARGILESHGFQMVRQRGGHMLMPCAVEDKTTSVPIPDHRELRVGTLLSIIRQSKLPRSLFESP